MKAKTKELLNLISKKKAEMRGAKINALIHEHTLKEKQKRMENRTPFDEWYDTWKIEPHSMNGMIHGGSAMRKRCPDIIWSWTEE